MPEDKNNTEEYSDDVINLVVTRLSALPPNVSISIGDSKNDEGLKIGQLIEHIKARDEIGKKMIEVQLSYLRSFKNSRPYAPASN